MQFTPRDMHILLAAYAYRTISSTQLKQILAPDAARTRLNQRLSLLFQHGYLLRIEQPQGLSEPRKPYVYVLDRKGAAVVAEHQGVAPHELEHWSPKDRHVKPLFLEHHLYINDVRIALLQSIAAHSFTLEAWHDERTLKRNHKDEVVSIHAPDGEEEQTRLYPDAYVAFRTDSLRFHRFIEVDRGTETVVSTGQMLRGWGRKVACYQAYYRNGFFERRYNAKGMAVLTVTTSEKRLANLKQATEHLGGNEVFWFSTFERVNDPATDILTSPIWEVATRQAACGIIET
jgi:hypothetical protein